MQTFTIVPDHSFTNSNWSEFGRYGLVREAGEPWRLLWREDNDRDPNPGEPVEIVVQRAEGKVTGLRYLDGEGNLLAILKGASLAQETFRSLLNDDGNQALLNALARDGLHVIGGGTPDGQWERYDDITTTKWNDLVQARSGYDYIKDHGGSDTYQGGSGWDTVTYDEWDFRDRVPASGIRADLAQGTIVGPDGRTDRVSGIESIRGFKRADVIRGDAKDNFFMGNGGADTLDGRGGFDYITHHWDTREDAWRKATVNLGEGFAIDGWGFRDTLRSIEGARGSGGDDRLVDSAVDNWFDADAGDDTLSLGRGDDWVMGGEGADIFRFRGSAFGWDTVEDFDGAAGDRLRILAADGLADLTIREVNGDTRVRLNADSVVVLQGVTGEVADFLVF